MPANWGVQQLLIPAHMGKHGLGQILINADAYCPVICAC